MMGLGGPTQAPPGVSHSMVSAINHSASAKIRDLTAREIFDSRGVPTIEVDLAVEKDGEFCGVFRSSVPSGTSTGDYEVHELRDADGHVSGAIHKVNEVIAPKLKGMDVRNQCDIDKYMVEVLDGTSNEWGWSEEWLGANSILAVSIAVCRAAAACSSMPLYAYIAQLAQRPLSKFVLPVPCFNMLSCPRLVGSGIICQEFGVLPSGASSFKDAMAMGSDIYHRLRDKIAQTYGPDMCSVDHHGSFAPPFKTDDEALKLLMEAIKATPYEDKVRLSVGVEASDFYDQTSWKYEVGGGMPPINAEGLMAIYQRWLTDYPIVSIEDPFQFNDWPSYLAFMNKQISGDVKLSGSAYQTLQVVGGRLLASNPRRMDIALEEGAVNALQLKITQAGCITEAIAVARMALDTHWSVIVSHCVGETEDPFLADLAVGLWCGQIKAGAPCRSEHLSKLNQLLRIEHLLGDKAIYAGEYFRHPKRWHPWRVKLTNAPELGHLDVIGSAEYDALCPEKKGTKPAQAGYPASVVHTYTCDSCHMEKNHGRVDAADGAWYCDDCWSAQAAGNAVSKMCQSCGNMAANGDYAPEDGLWYCKYCWDTM